MSQRVEGCINLIEFISTQQFETHTHKHTNNCDTQHNYQRLNDCCASTAPLSVHYKCFQSPPPGSRNCLSLRRPLHRPNWTLLTNKSVLVHEITARTKRPSKFLLFIYLFYLDMNLKNPPVSCMEQHHGIFLVWGWVQLEEALRGLMWLSMRMEVEAWVHLWRCWMKMA